MAEYIRRDTVLRCIKESRDGINWGQSEDGDAFLHYSACLYRTIASAECIPAADVRPVVLCRNCKWCHAGYCEKYDDLIPFGCANKPWEDWFCADGKKREER